VHSLAREAASGRSCRRESFRTIQPSCSFRASSKVEGICAAVHRSFKFGSLTLAGAREANTEAEFVFFATDVDHLKDPARQFPLSASDIAILNPATKTCPIFRSRRDSEITKAIYRKLPVLTASDWALELRRLLNSADDSGAFVGEPGDGRLPLYEGKYFHHYDHRWVTNDADGDRPLTASERVDPSFFLRPRHWYPGDDVRHRFGKKWKHSWVFAWRDIARSTDERSFIATVVPSLAVPHTAKVVFVDEVQVPLLSTLIANSAAFAFDFVARQKIGGTHMSSFIVEQLPIVPIAMATGPSAWSDATSLREWLLPRVIELIYTAWDLESFAHALGCDSPPFQWNLERRFLIRCELDAAFFHLYGLSRDDTDYVMDTFPIVCKHDIKTHGEYRTKRVILEIYDAMAEAMRLGKSYRTRLDPPPADSRVAHPAASAFAERRAEP